MAKLKDETRPPLQPARTRAETRALEQLVDIRKTLDTLTPTVIAELVRKGRHTNTADGYPSRTLGDGTSGGGSELTSVETSANQAGFAGTSDDYFGRCTVSQPEPDPTGEAIANVFDQIHQVAKIMHSIDSELGYINHVRHAASGRQPTSTGGPCQCCGRDVPGTENDRLRAGYCNACSMAWIRAGRPDRRQFEVERRRKLGHNDEDAGQHDDPTRTVSDSDTLHVSVSEVRP